MGYLGRREALNVRGYLLLGKRKRGYLLWVISYWGRRMLGARRVPLGMEGEADGTGGVSHWDGG